jgi:hypothetical protein
MDPFLGLAAAGTGCCPVERAFDNRPTDGVEAVLTYVISGWPTWVHHEGREMHWHVLEIIEPDTGEATPARTDRYILLVDGPFAYMKGRDGEQCITATRRGGRWWITPNTAAHPRRGNLRTLSSNLEVLLVTG